MTVSAPATPRAGSAARRAAQGSTLVEVMLVAVIISLLAAVAVPLLIRAKRRAVATATANDLRVFSAAFEGYAHERGVWPAETSPGVVPPEMVDRIEKTAWERVTPIGGRYDWEYKQTHGGVIITAAIQIADTSTAAVVQDIELWEAVDRAIDDGNLSTGNFRTGSDGGPIFIIAP